MIDWGAHRREPVGECPSVQSGSTASSDSGGRSAYPSVSSSRPFAMRNPRARSVLG